MEITDPTIIATYYQALLDRNSQYVGIFYVGVKTTNVFCIATCRARKPKKENVTFYTSPQDAINNGFRPCKICRPTTYTEEYPAVVQQALALLKVYPNQKISDQRLRQEGISPERVRRWFKQYYGQTFQAYQRMQRISNAYLDLREGMRTTDVAFGQGYESLSGFGHTYKKLMGKAPAYGNGQEVLLVNRLGTPLGSMFIAASSEGICLLEFTDRATLEREIETLQKRLKAQLLIGVNTHIQKAKQELKAYFTKQQTTFTVPLHTPGTAFQKEVWSALQTIDFGQTSTYQQLAQSIQRPNAVRAVGNANGRNRIAIMIPCHRLIRTNGKLTGYGGGLERKRWLLNFELG